MGKRLIAFALLAAVILGTAACTKETKTVMESSAVGKKWMEFAASKAAGYSFTNKVIGDNYSSQGAVILLDDGLNASVIRELQNLEKHLVEDVTEDTEVAQKFRDFWTNYSFYVLVFHNEEKAVYIGFKDDLCAFFFAQEDSEETAYFRVDRDTDEFTERLEQLVLEQLAEGNNKSQ